MIKLSHITSYITCPRLCYYRLHFEDEVFTEMNAVREIYLSFRRGFDLKWAEERAKALYSNFDYEVFKKASEKFVYREIGLKTVEWDTVLKSERLEVVMTIDEIVSDGQREFPLFLSLNSPEEGIWFKDVIKAGIAGIIAGYDESKIYYAYSGELRDVEVSYGIKRKALKLIERVKMIKKGFLPERRESEYCRFCSFKEDCKAKPETFASKFL